MLAWGQLQGVDGNVEMTFNTNLFQPILLPLIFGILFEHDYPGEFGDRFVCPSPGDLCKEAVYFAKHPFQKENRFRCDYSRFQPYLNVGEQSAGEFFHM